MKTITKILGLGTAAAVAAAVGWQALADPGPGYGPGAMHGYSGMGMMGGGMMGMGPGVMGWHAVSPEARLALVKTEIKITPEQTAAWNAYAKTVQEAETSIRERHEGVDPAAIRDMSAADRTAFMTQMHGQMENTFESVKTATDGLLGVLDDAQKAKASQFLTGLAGPGFGMAQHMGFGGFGMGHGGWYR